MTPHDNSDDPLFADYAARLGSELGAFNWADVERLARDLRACWSEDRQLFICGNGGSAGNAVHLANDFLFGIASDGRGMRVTALPANTAVLTCLANDVAYSEVFSRQLHVLARAGDRLLVLSGSGNSPNVVEALRTARALGMTTSAVIGFDGGLCKELADLALHFPISDMQIAEDLQLTVGHMVMKWLKQNPVKA